MGDAAKFRFIAGAGTGAECDCHGGIARQRQNVHFAQTLSLPQLDRHQDKRFPLHRPLASLHRSISPLSSAFNVGDYRRKVHNPVEEGAEADFFSPKNQEGSRIRE